MIRKFGLLKVPLIWLCRPKVIEHTDERIEVVIRLRRRTKNHLGSMYFGALAIGADVTGGFLAMDPIKESGRQIQLIFKDFKADFLKRPEGDVHFYCNDGLAVRDLVKHVDLLLVVVSQNSSNSKRLEEIGREIKIPSYLIDGPSDINKKWLKNVKTVGITAGASAPEAVVMEVVDKLKKIENSNVKVMDGIKEKVEFKLPAGIRYKKNKKELIA